MGGILDLDARKLLSDPGECFRSVTANPEVAGL